MLFICHGFCPAKAGFRLRHRRILNFCCCTQDKFVMVVAPGPFVALRAGTQLLRQLADTLGKARIYPQYKSCTVTAFWLRDKLYPRLRFATARRGATRVVLIKICTWPSFAKATEGKDGKKCAIPFLPTKASAKVGLAL